ncbi:MFS transporter [Lonsdalea quercina]|uniref:MFS transporter n=1 Tax=Lonsdalea quercina TaxID=71657 RepID=UPI003974F7CB
MLKIKKNQIDIFIVAGAFFLEVLDATIFTPALKNIADDFNISLGYTTITIAAYACALAVFTPLNLYLFKGFDNRKKFLWGGAIVAISSLFCALSTNVYLLGGCRVLQGIGASIIVPAGRTIVLKNVSKKEIPVVMAYLVWPALIAPIFAPIIGGYLSQFYGWRYLFIVITIMTTIILFLSIMWLSTDKVDRDDVKGSNVKNVLLWGGFILSLFVSFMFINLKLIKFSIILVIITTFFLFCFIKSQRKNVFDNEIMSKSLFRVNLFSGSFFRIGIYCFPIFLIVGLITVFDYTPLESGKCIVFIFFGNLVIKPIAALLISGVNDIRRFFIISSFMTFLSVLPFWNIHIYKNINYIYLFCFLHGISRSFQFLGYSSVAFYQLEKKKLYEANVIMNSAMQLNALIGQAIPSVILTVTDMSVLYENNKFNFMYISVFIVCIFLFIPFVLAFSIKYKNWSRS